MLNSERVLAVFSLKTAIFTPVCDLVKTGVFEQILKCGQELFSSCHFLLKVFKHYLALFWFACKGSIKVT